MNVLILHTTVLQRQIAPTLMDPINAAKLKILELALFAEVIVNNLFIAGLLYATSNNAKISFKTAS